MISAILRHVNFEVVKCVLIASPGFTKDLFFDHMMAYAQKVAGGNSKMLISISILSIRAKVLKIKNVGNKFEK